MKKLVCASRFTIVVFVLSALSSCVKNEFDAPATANVDPDLAVSMTLAELQGLATGTTPFQITTNEVVAGIVTADDLSGNFYKEIILEDSTGAIAVEIDQSNYNTLFPIGRRVYIKCKDLYIADDGDGNFQLGIKDLATIGRIPSGLVPRYLIGGKWGLSVAPKEVTMSALTLVPSQMLVRISDVEFSSTDAGQPYANAATQQSVNRIVEDCNGNTIDLYSSGYANFAGEITPTGKGFITAVYKLYGGSGELQIRNALDVNMSGPRCGAGGGGSADTVGTGALMSVFDVRAAYPGATAVFASGTKIRGTVVSDFSTLNINGNNMILQDGTSGIIVRFTAPHTFALNDSLEIDLSGDSLQTFQAGVEINYVNASAVTILGTGSVTPSAQTASSLNSNLTSLESTLVKISGATLSGGSSGTYSGSVTITDATGTAVLYTRSGATFSGTAYPGGTVNVTGFVSNFNGVAEIILRSTADVQ
jgi:hypothetical protein